MNKPSIVMFTPPEPISNKSSAEDIGEVIELLKSDLVDILSQLEERIEALNG